MEFGTIFGGIRDIVALPGQFFASVFGGSDDDDSDNARPNRQTQFDQNGNQFDAQGNKLVGIICGLLLFRIAAASANAEQVTHETKFLGTLKNVTQIQGKDASFTCMVDNLGGHRIAWIKVDSKAILAIHDHVITNNARLTVTMNDKVTWTLHIKNVQRSDNGWYMCQVNTGEVKKQMAYLEVVIPPDIASDETTGDLMVPEGGTAKLICRARGYPKPVITWRKEDGNHIIIKEGQGGKRKVKSYEGEILNLPKITRSEMGAYLCIASNGVPPSVSKRMTVQVHFHPLIQVPNQLVAAPRGTDVSLECLAEASPKAINYWTRDNGEMIITNDKFNMTEEVLSQYGVRMRLQIKSLGTRDFSGYKCVSQNSMGNAEGGIHIHELNPVPVGDDGSNDDFIHPSVDDYTEDDDNEEDDDERGENEDNYESVNNEYGDRRNKNRNSHKHNHEQRQQQQQRNSRRRDSTRGPLMDSFQPGGGGRGLDHRKTSLASSATRISNLTVNSNSRINYYVSLLVIITLISWYLAHMCPLSGSLHVLEVESNYLSVYSNLVQYILLVAYPVLTFAHLGLSQSFLLILTTVAAISIT